MPMIGVGGSEVAFRQSPLVAGKSFRVVRAWARSLCQAEVHPKRHVGPLPFLISARQPFTVP